MKIKPIRLYHASQKVICFWIDKPEYTKIQFAGNAAVMRPECGDYGQIIFYIEPVEEPVVMKADKEKLKQIVRMLL